MSRRRVMVVQPSMQPPGGGNGVAVWLVQALVPDYDVTIVSWRPVEVDPINRFFGTRLRRDDFYNIVIPRTWRALPNVLPLPLTLLRSSLLHRFARSVNGDHDVMIGVNNEANFGRRGIQYIHYPTYSRPRPLVDLRWYHRSKALLAAYYRFSDLVAVASPNSASANLSLANSDWTAEETRRLLGGEVRTVYPPVADPEPPLPLGHRQRSFLAIGRISPEKDYERLIRIVAAVRQREPQARLTIIGTSDPSNRRYLNRVQRAARAHGSMVDFQFNVSHAAVRQAIAAHRYGLHGMRDEHFGMAPAEMVRGGCVVWLPRSGGQVEIVGNEPALVYDSDEEAVEKILRVMADGEEERRLRDLLTDRAEMFSTDRFVRQIREVVAEFAGG